MNQLCIDISCLDSLVSISEISSLKVISVAAQAGLCQNWWLTLKNRFSHDRAHFLINTPTESSFKTRDRLILYLEFLEFSPS